MTTAQQINTETTGELEATYTFTFQKHIDRARLPELAGFPEKAYANVRVEFEGTEQQALDAARTLYSADKAAEAVRMGLEFDRLPPEVLNSAIQAMAAQHSKATGETWEARPDSEIPLNVFADLLQMANDSYWSKYEKSFELNVDVANERNIDITLAMRRA